MGLDAVVFTNRKNLRLGADEKFALLDPKTGQTYFEDAKTERKYRDQLVAAEDRIGNIATVGALRTEVLQLLEPGSFTVQKVLYDGTHSGDRILIETLPVLSAELDRLNKAGYMSPLLREFVGKLEGLVRAANQESNPIVFC